MTKNYTCPAEKLIDTSGIIHVDNYTLTNWNLEDVSEFKKDGADEDTNVFDFRYMDDDGYEYIYEFSIEALENAVILGNVITLRDSEDAEVEIKCFNLTPNYI